MRFGSRFRHLPEGEAVQRAKTFVPEFWEAASDQIPDFACGSFRRWGTGLSAS